MPKRARASAAANALIARHFSSSCSRSTAARAIPSTSSGVHRNPVSPSRTTSGRPPARAPITGTPQRSPPTGARPERAAPGREEEEVRACEEGRDGLQLPEKEDVLAHIEVPRLKLGIDTVWAVAHHNENARYLTRNARVNTDHIL